MIGPQLYLKCEWCGCFFAYEGGRRRSWCTDAHKVAAWRKANGFEPVGKIFSVDIVSHPAVPPDSIGFIPPEVENNLSDS